MTSGHTDRATINARKPLTEGMREMLNRLNLARKDMVNLPHGPRNSVRALVNRGLAEETEGFAYITDAGRESLK